MGLLEGLAALAMEQGHLGGLTHIIGDHVIAALVGGDGAGGLVHHDVSPQAVNLVLGADAGDELQNVVGHGDAAQKLLAAEDALPLGGLGLLPGVHEAEGVGLVGDAALDHLTAFLRGEGAVDLDGQAEAIQELGAQVALLGVHGADEDELGGVADGDALALHVVAAHSGGVQQHVN